MPEIWSVPQQSEHACFPGNRDTSTSNPSFREETDQAVPGCLKKSSQSERRSFRNHDEPVPPKSAPELDRECPEPMPSVIPVHRKKSGPVEPNREQGAIAQTPVIGRKQDWATRGNLPRDTNRHETPDPPAPRNRLPSTFRHCLESCPDPEPASAQALALTPLHESLPHPTANAIMMGISEALANPVWSMIRLDSASCSYRARRPSGDPGAEPLTL